MKIPTIKGMNDVGPPDIAVWQWVEKTAREVFETAGFEELRTPPLEEEALFTRSIGSTTDIVEKEMYRFPDRKGKMLALRPEGTASVVRAFTEHYAPKGEYSRFYYLGPMFRYERPQKGRYRLFYQIGAEIFGAEHPFADAELIHLADEIFGRLGLKEVSLQINSLGCKNCRPAFREALIRFLEPLQSKLCPDCQRRFTQNPLRVLDCKNEGCISVTQKAPAMLDHLCGECSAHFEGVQRGLRTLATPFKINRRMVRGLDYYERTAFEFSSNQLGSQNAVAGGGRYDDLVSELGGPDVPAVGFALGMERLVSLVAAHYPMHLNRPKIFFAALGEAAQIRILSYMAALRKEGFEVQAEFGDRSLKSLMRQADRLGADYVLIFGEDELKTGQIQIKEMKKEGAQKQIPFESLLVFFSSQKPRGEVIL